ncbi:hypothetical protein PILCRDRAFT_827899 [Piloderma croceum F 1598]|uniref:Fe2OG dioxygenase domain-containing protein n=1 Tax=Piloderma croceum (strain F 1598) TaxID=765440 RepID=A0A0C3F467_PILCF|nr:hypothetical protein PILCRDRAFT_827899 [Piloderma croceum F 1598]
MSLVKVAQESDSTFHHIPIVDLENVSSEDPVTRRALVDHIRDACINVGFLYVKNHGIPEETIQGALSASKDFFSLLLETKIELLNKKNPNFKGYSPLLSANNNPENAGDLHEGFEFGYEPLNSSSSLENENENEGVMAGANVWPSALPGFREAALKYYHAAVKLGQQLFPLFALALELPENFFDDKTKNSAALMKFLHYPPQTGSVDDSVIGIGAHTELCFTILWQEPGIQALQVLNTEEQWIDAPPIPGTLVINLGDQFARWTNDVFKSTVHRAVNRCGVRRYSIPLFFGTDYNVKLEPIPSCVSVDSPQKYDVVTAGDYVKEKFKSTYGH